MVKEYFRDCNLDQTVSIAAFQFVSDFAQTVNSYQMWISVPWTKQEPYQQDLSAYLTSTIYGFAKEAK